MPTRSGRTFSVGKTSTPMDPTLKNTLNTLIARMDQMDRHLQEFREQANVRFSHMT